MRRVILALAVLLASMLSAAAADDAKDTRRANRLQGEASPYLRQHAHNPVDWYPWGKQAFDKARAENKPILLSVGYSTCHWCHVMARESYENRAIARLLNKYFVAIKVDRERRPEVDETYMLATQLLTGHGGWPNNVFLTPDRKPFFAGTYFPQKEFKSIVQRIADMWRDDETQLRSDADGISSAVEAVMSKRVAAADLTPQAIDAAGGKILEKLDSFNGGFSVAPKFPQAPLLLFLLRLAEKDGTAQALSAVTLTLDRMLDGGIRDHVGGGFHRYTVDAQWRVPHFEKMLYTQAQLTQVLLWAFRLTGQERYAQAARDTLDYVLSDLTHPQGGFYSARDADSRGADGTVEEGAYYVWTPEDLQQALGDSDAAIAKQIFAFTGLEGAQGKSVLHLPASRKELAATLQIDAGDLAAETRRLSQRLAAHRAKRPPPMRDEKIVAAWNGLMIAAFAQAASELGDSRFREAALRAAGFVWSQLYDDSGLKRIYFDGRTDIDGRQEDYAFIGLAFVALYDLNNDPQWLRRAEILASQMNVRFLDKETGDYHMTVDNETIGRAKMRTDSSTPSGNAAALDLFGKLMRRRPAPHHRIQGEALLSALSGIALMSPDSSGYTLLSGDRMLRGESGPRQFLAKGAVRASAKLARTEGRLDIRLTIAPGWHINSNEPLEDTFIATHASLVGLPKAVVVYPPATRRKLGFHERELALYEGNVDLRILLPQDLPSALKAALRLQACSDRICLEPENVELAIPLDAAPKS
jgi:hypothetical protein